MRAEPLAVGQPRRWPQLAALRRRPTILGSLPKLVVISAIGLLVFVDAAVMLERQLALALGPEAALKSYLAALDRGDAKGAWSLTTTLAPRFEADADLLAQQDLEAQLRAIRPSHAHLTITGAGQDGDQTELDVAFDEGGSQRTATYSLRVDPNARQFGLGPGWKVLLEPAVLAIRVPPVARSITVDGRKFATAADGTLRLAVFPGWHLVDITAVGPYATSVIPLPAESADVASEPLMLLPAFTIGATASALDVVEGSVERCAAIGGSALPKCPFSGWYPRETGAYGSLLGTPTISVFTDSTGQVVAIGRALAEYPYVDDGERRAVVGGAFHARLAWDGEEFTLLGFDRGPALPQLHRPDVKEPAILAAVRSAFESCAAIMRLRDDDCPSRPSTALPIVHLSWKLNGDPLKSATVAFDRSRGLFEVTGHYSMTVTLKIARGSTADDDVSATDSGAYRADVDVQDSKPVFITFE